MAGLACLAIWAPHAAAVPQGTSTITPGPTPTAPSYTALFLATSHHCSGGDCWTSEDALRREYNRYSYASSKVQPAIRTVQSNKNDASLLRWEQLGFNYFYTSASSDFRSDSSLPLYVPTADAEEVLARPNSLGLYMHEVVSYNAATNGWKWKEAASAVDWERLDRWATVAAHYGKKVMWSEPSHGWVALLNDGKARYYLKKWAGTLVPTYGTNFPDQINGWSKPGATEVAAAYGGALGVSVQSWFFRDGGGTLTSAAVQSLADAGYQAGARYFQVEGRRDDMQFGESGAASSEYIKGIRAYLDGLQSKSARSPVATNASRVPLHQFYNHATKDHYYSRSAATPPGYTAEGIVGYVYNVRAPGTVPLYEMYSSYATDHYYSSRDADMKKAYESHLGYRWDTRSSSPASWSSDRSSADIVGYVLQEPYADTVSLKEMWNPGASGDPWRADHYYTTSDWLASKFRSVNYPDPPYVTAYVFDNDGRSVDKPLAQMWNNVSVDHFYTASPGEITQYQGLGYEFQENAGLVRTEPIAGAIPLYEAYSGISTDHFYTIDPYQLYSAWDSWYQYRNIRVVGYVPPGPQGTSTLPFWQLWTAGQANNVGYADHFYTTSTWQRDNAINSWRAYQLQGTAGYLAADTYPTSRQYGGDNGSVDTPAEAAALGQALAASSNAVGLWNGLTVTDKNYMLAEEDPSFAQWVGKIDVQAPGPAEGISLVEHDVAARVATVSWNDGDDPAIGTDVPGTQVDSDRTKVRVGRLVSGAWQFDAWRTSPGNSLEVTNTVGNEQVRIEVQTYDRANRPSPVAAGTVTIPAGPVADSAALPAIIVGAAVGCARFCPVATAALRAIVSAAPSALPAIAAGVYTVGGTKWDVIRFSRWEDYRQKWRGDTAAQQRAWEQDMKDGETAARRRERNREENRQRKDKFDIHHVVPVRLKYAAYARSVMRRCRLSLNDPVNLVALARKKHSGLNSYEYGEAVNKHMKIAAAPPNGNWAATCTNGEQQRVITALHGIKGALWAGAFPGQKG